MLTVYSDDHALQDGKAELIDGLARFGSAPALLAGNEGITYADLDARVGFMHELMAARARRLAPAAPAAPVVVNRFRLPGA